MRVMIWVKAENKDLVLNVGDWWSQPQLSLIPSSPLETEWIPPAEGTVKFNVDGSFSEHQAGCGGVLRNFKGDVTAIFSRPINSFGADFTELIVIRTTLEFFKGTKEFGKALLEIESNLQVVLNWLKDITARPWR
ncbi:hypothetical protein V6N11_042052 [Hibiscus sabdariffa]|uniref:RNase H type-1 domain-containing protein n=1 Tax=Hibiscus sabdariffa TaxID=183260 RepID=A0ABR2QV52_9ROSI